MNDINYYDFYFRVASQELCNLWVMKGIRFKNTPINLQTSINNKGKKYV